MFARIPAHIERVIELNGGNEYLEGRRAFKRNWKGARSKGKLSKHTFLPALLGERRTSIVPEGTEDEWDDENEVENEDE